MCRFSFRLMTCSYTCTQNQRADKNLLPSLSLFGKVNETAFTSGECNGCSIGKIFCCNAELRMTASYNRTLTSIKTKLGPNSEGEEQYQVIFGHSRFASLDEQLRARFSEISAPYKYFLEGNHFLTLFLTNKLAPCLKQAIGIM